MKRIKTYKEFHLDNDALDKAINHETSEYKIRLKYFKLQRLRRQNYLIKNGIEKEQDRLGICD
jgi:hypothetical protein